MNNKMVSIILPVYNAERFLRQCLDSIIAQSYEHWELIAIDDGSKDGSFEILDSYSLKDTRIKVMSKQNEGVSVARNVALSKASCEYVYFVDADDVVMPKALEILVSEMEWKKATFVKSDFLPIDGQGKQLFVNKKQVLRRKYSGQVLNAEKFFKKILMKEYFLWTCLFRKEIIDTYHIRFIPHCRLMEDAAFIVDYLRYSERNVYKDACVYGYRKYKGTASTAKKDYTKDLRLVQNEILSSDNTITRKLNSQLVDKIKETCGTNFEKKFCKFKDFSNRIKLYIKYQVSK